MTESQVPAQIIDFYTTTYAESERLTGKADGVLEMVRTQELLRRHLPPVPAAVLDVGGGPGTHARWLVEDGYQVHLVDPVERHVHQAEDAGCTVEVGDARYLSASDASWDVVLMLGPLYHLVDPDDRAKALLEAVRVARPGGMVAAAAISRYSALIDHTATTLLERDQVRTSLEGILETGTYDGREGFTQSYFHTAQELGEELAAAGFVDVAVYGVEGPAWGLLKAVERHSGQSPVGSPLFASVLHAARIAEDHPALLAASSHLLAVGYAPGPRG